MTMYNEILEDLSCYYWLKTSLSGTPFIKVVDAFPDSKLSTPVVSIEADRLVFDGDLELGGDTELKLRYYTIDIFAVNKTQRDEIGYKLFNELKVGIPVFDYNVGFPENSVIPPQINCLTVLEKDYQVIKIFPELVKEMYFRATLSFVAKLNRVY